MFKKVVAQVVLDVATGVEDDETRNPSRGSSHQCHRDHHQHDATQRFFGRQSHARECAKGLRMVSLDGVDGSAT